jgi:hypothetical protein
MPTVSPRFSSLRRSQHNWSGRCPHSNATKICDRTLRRGADRQRPLVLTLRLDSLANESDMGKDRVYEVLHRHAVIRIQRIEDMAERIKRPGR